MREIKFRAWDKDQKCMVTWDWFDTETIDQVFKNNSVRFELMQHAGLKDKNGKEIYEGDIVHRYSSPKDYNINYLCTVEFKYGCFLFVPFERDADSLNHTYRDTTFYQSTIEIIGNIKENPELLEKI